MLRRDRGCVTRAAGREIGRELAPDAHGGTEARLYAALAALGFQPRRESHTPKRLAYRLCDCPYREAARENPLDASTGV